MLPRLFRNNIPGHTTRAPPLGFELATNGIKCHVLANLDKTSESLIYDIQVLINATGRLASLEARPLRLSLAD